MQQTPVDLREVEFPKTPVRQAEMRARIDALTQEGYTKFRTIKKRCLNSVESPDPDLPVPGFTLIGFWPDCEKAEVETGDYYDFLLCAGK